MLYKEMKAIVVKEISGANITSWCHWFLWNILHKLSDHSDLAFPHKYTCPSQIYAASPGVGSKRYWLLLNSDKTEFMCFKQNCVISTLRRCPWCNGYHHRKWTQWHEFQSWTRLITFHITLIPLGKVWIQLFSLQLWVDSRTDWVLQPWWGN